MTKAIIIATVVVLVAWDVFAAVKTDDEHETITRVIRRSSRNHPVIPFALGLLMGHLFWSNF